MVGKKAGVGKKMIAMKKCHICEECGMAYFGNKRLCECDTGCKKSEICDVEEIRYSLKFETGREPIIPGWRQK